MGVRIEAFTNESRIIKLQGKKMMRVIRKTQKGQKSLLL